jgi:DNA-binding winged helix-turn-helix (wHTH) protein/pimeloyl-ACP methyl ester carboxylesterase
MAEDVKAEKDTRFRFGDFTVDLDTREIHRGAEQVKVEPQVFDVLAHLLRERRRVVTKEELLDTVWGTRMVSESALTSRIKAVRRALGDDGQRQEVIRTAHGRGFRFVADVTTGHSSDTLLSVPVRADPRADPGSAPASGPVGDGRPDPDVRLRQTVRFCTAGDGTRLAYALMGDGPPLVKAANWLTHLEHDLESPVWRHWHRDLSRRHSLLRYDERGCGLSDLDVDEFGVDAWVSDLEAVVDAAGLDRFPLLGISQGGAVALEFAARHPERVSKLILYGAFVKGPVLRAQLPEQRREAALMVDLAEVGWGRLDPVFRQVFTMRFLPHGPPEAWTAFDTLQTRTTTASNAVRFLEAFNAVDVEDAARQVSVPTLVMHARDEILMPMAEGLRIAQLVRDSTFVSLDSANHLLLGNEPAWPRFLDEVEEFLNDD